MKRWHNEPTSGNGATALGSKTGRARVIVLTEEEEEEMTLIFALVSTVAGE